MSWFFGGSVLASFIIFIIKIIISSIVAASAWNKGRNFFIWFVYAYLLSIMAIIHLLIIPADEDGILYRKHKAICPECTRPVDPDVTKCPICKSDLTEKYLFVPSPPSEKWVISMIISDILGIILMKYITPDLISGAMGGMGEQYQGTIHNFQETMEAFGVPRDYAAIIAAKMMLGK